MQGSGRFMGDHRYLRLRLTNAYNGHWHGPSSTRSSKDHEVPLLCINVVLFFECCV